MASFSAASTARLSAIATPMRAWWRTASTMSSTTAITMSPTALASCVNARTTGVSPGLIMCAWIQS